MTKMLKPAAVVLASGGSHRMWVLRRLKNDPVTASIPVVIYAATDTPENEIEARRLGVRLYLRKPDPQMPEQVAEIARKFQASARSGLRALVR
jgi:CheY-like chemotaxis protein